MPKHPSSGQYAIIGLSVVAGQQPDRSERMIASEAARLAIKDAGLTPRDIDGAIDLRRTGGGGDRASYVDAYSRMLGLNNCFYFVVGRGGALAGRGIAHAEKAGYWGKALGDLRAVSHHSWMAARHMAVYGTTSRQLGAISVAERTWACKNPEAKMYGRPITVEDHQNSPILADPYHLLDISLVSDGGIAFILTTADRAKDRPKPPVYVLGQGFGEVSADLWWEKKNFTHMAVPRARDQAFGQAALTLDDVDCCEFYDCFTAEVLFQLEDYGFCKKGEGGPFVESGAMGPGGSIPVNTGGGLLSCYHLGDLTGMAESIRQLRGEASERQIKDCNVVLTTGHGGELVSPGMCSNHTSTLLGRHQ